MDHDYNLSDNRPVDEWIEENTDLLEHNMSRCSWLEQAARLETLLMVLERADISEQDREEMEAAVEQHVTDVEDRKESEEEAEEGEQDAETEN